MPGFSNIDTTTEAIVRILRLCLEVPCPPNDGTRIEPFHTTCRLAQAGHELVLVAFQRQPGDTTALRRYCELHAFPFAGGNSAFHLLRGALEGFPINYVKYRRQDLLDCCLRLVTRRTYDLLIVDFSAMGWYGLQLHKRMGIPLVTRWHNLDSLIWQRWCDGQTNAAKRWLGKRQLAYVHRFERGLAQNSELCLMVSALDAELLSQSAPGARVRYVPAGIDTEHYAPRKASAQEPGSILFLSSNCQWHPNVDAARWLYQTIMPQVWRALPHARLYMSGENPTREMQRWASERVVFTGFVPDERDLLARAAITVIPMRLGGGIKLKLITALAMAKAVVTTPQGAEGFAGLVDGRHALVQSGARGFASAIVELLEDPDRSRRLGEAGRALVQATCEWRVIADAYEKAIAEVAGERRSALA